MRYRKIRRKHLNSMGKFVDEAKLKIVKISFKVIQYENYIKYASGSNSTRNFITGTQNLV